MIHKIDKITDPRVLLLETSKVTFSRDVASFYTVTLCLPLSWELEAWRSALAWCGHVG